MPPYPRVENLPLQSKNKVLFKVHRSPRSTLSYIVLALLLSIAVFVLNYLFPDFRISQTVPVLKWISFRWLAIFPAAVLLEMVRKHHDDQYIFGRHRITHLNGRLSLSYSIPVLKYQDIRAISVTQDIVGRMFNYGNVEISTAAQEGSELVIEGIYAPWDLADLIDELRSRSKRIAFKSPDSGQDELNSEEVAQLMEEAIGE